MRRCCVRLLAGLIVTITATLSARAEVQGPQYLLFQIFTGTPDQSSGVFHRGLSKADLLTDVRQIGSAVQVTPGVANRLVGFSVGPIAMDEGETEARQLIDDAFAVAVQTNLAVAFHLDDYMFWSQASASGGRLLRTSAGTTEWTDWSGTPAPGMQIDWLPNVNLPPQLCYENPAVIAFVVNWTKNVVGQEIAIQYKKLAQAGKGALFAGVISGWESNMSYGYCSMTQLGFSATNLPANLEHEREVVLQRQIARWSQGIANAGIATNRIFTHVAPMPEQNYEQLVAAVPAAKIMQMPNSTAFDAYWVAFNSTSSPGFSAYVDADRFSQIYAALQANNGISWAMAEGSNLMLSPTGPVAPSFGWESYLARNFNHGAVLVNIYGGFQGAQMGVFQQAAQSSAAIAAYQKFLSGGVLVE